MPELPQAGRLRERGDTNGNMVSNTNSVNTGQNKSFTYNILSLPMVATVSNGTATYTYDAAGNKLRKVSIISGATTTTEYISGIQYKNSTTAVDFIQTEEGKAVNNSGVYDYNYYLGDNLGNTRVTFGTKTGTAVQYQRDDYYPFGLELGRSVVSPKNEYLYNKKELQEEFTEYDYGARFYDPVIGRWNVIDPMSETSRRWSPYNYVENDPIRLTDPDGMEVQEQPSATALHDALEGKTVGFSGSSSGPPGTRKVTQRDHVVNKRIPLSNMPSSGSIDISHDADIGGGFSMTNNGSKTATDASKSPKAPTGTVTPLGDMSAFFNLAGLVAPSASGSFGTGSILFNNDVKIFKGVKQLLNAGDAASPLVETVKESVKKLHPSSTSTFSGYWLQTSHGHSDTITINSKGFTGNAVPLYLNPNGSLTPTPQKPQSCCDVK